MQNFINHTILNHTFILSPNRVIFWEEEKTLILSDLHLGKTGHFRKHGIAVPQSIFKADMQCLITQLQYFSPKKIIIIGDMFHSHANKEHDFFLKWRSDFAAIEFNLVKGNHDILNDEWYQKANIILHQSQLQIGDFIFTHDIIDVVLQPNQYVFSGHIHPGISIKGIAKQSLRFACFYFTKNYAVLPAFSKFTGTHPIKKIKGDAVFALVENKIISV
jgi:uncharacterized protein